METGHLFVSGINIRVFWIGVIVDFGGADKILDVSLREVEGDHTGEHGGVVSSIFVLDLVFEEYSHVWSFDVFRGI